MTTHDGMQTYPELRFPYRGRCVDCGQKFAAADQDLLVSRMLLHVEEHKDPEPK